MRQTLVACLRQGFSNSESQLKIIININDVLSEKWTKDGTISEIANATELKFQRILSTCSGNKRVLDSNQHLLLASVG